LTDLFKGVKACPPGNLLSIEAIEQIVASEWRERVSHQDWSIEFAPARQLHRFRVSTFEVVG